jgi:rod shape-determining protein MreD
MRAKVLVYAAVIFIFILLQSTVFEYMKVFNVRPNLMIVFVICMALLSGNVEAAVTGFFAGLLQDVLFGHSIGFYALMGMYLGYAAGSSNRRLYRDKLFVAVLFVFVWSFIYEFAVYFFKYFGSIMTGDIAFFYPIGMIIFPEALYNSFVTVPVFLLMLILRNHFEGRTIPEKGE